MTRYLATALFTCSLSAMTLLHAAPTLSADRYGVIVDAPFVELHTGPGEGYPTFHVAERGEVLQLEKRKLDWIKVKDRHDVYGWMSLTEAAKTSIVNTQMPFSSVLADELNNQHYGVGISAGAFELDTIFSLDMVYRVFSSFGGELGFSKITGVYSTSNMFTGGVRFSFFPFGKIAPYLKAGMGELLNTPRSLLVGGKETNNSIVFAGGGLQYRLQRNLALHSDVGVYGLTDLAGNQIQFTSWQAGIRALF